MNRECKHHKTIDHLFVEIFNPTVQMITHTNWPCLDDIDVVLELSVTSALACMLCGELEADTVKQKNAFHFHMYTQIT